MNDPDQTSFSGKPISEIAHSLGLTAQDIIPYGNTKAKVRLDVLKRNPERGKLILVSAITPTPAGEGKTTTTIGLGQALAQLGKSVCLALREPSMGPCMGMKGGATGGGLSQVIPADEINLHFTGDFHAITSANNLLSALLDNRIYHDKHMNIDPRRVTWRRVMDMNDRALRKIILGLGGVLQGVPREGGFDITAASEIMAILCLAQSHEDLKNRLDKVLVAFTREGEPVTAGQLQATGAMTALLKDALLPNLVQTNEGVPAFIHGGPFANIAHGCNSVLATKMALSLSDWAITEAGFGFDLGAEKFFDIKCQSAGLDTAAVVLVVSCRALKMHGGVGVKELSGLNLEALEKGMDNLDKHVENIAKFGEKPIVCLNRFAGDRDEEIDRVRKHCETRLKVPFAISNVFEKGGKGGLDLARAVVEYAEKVSSPFHPLYDWNDEVTTKIETVAREMYGAGKIIYARKALRDLKSIEKLGYGNLPVCIAKTPTSLTDDPKIHGRPENFLVTVKEILIAAGAGFLIPITGDIMRMPGLPKNPQADNIDVVEGKIRGIK
jgi:formate--tetrahydrofolate ligase